MSVKFPLARFRRSRARRLGLSLVVAGAALFGGSLYVARGARNPALLAVGMAGALLLSLGLRRLLLGAGPLRVSSRWAWFGPRAVPLPKLVEVSLHEGLVAVRTEDGRTASEELEPATAAAAAAEIARRAGLRPAEGEGGRRWIRR